MLKPWIIYEFRDERGRRVMTTWFRERRIQKKARILLDQKVDLLERCGPDLPPNLLAPVAPYIFKLKVRAQGVQLRPHLCEGPVNEHEFTFLCGAVERDGELEPHDVAEQSAVNRLKILDDNNMRMLYERFVPKTQG